MRLDGRAVWGRSIPGIVGWNPAKDMGVYLLVCSVGRGPCDKLWEQFEFISQVCVCVISELSLQECDYGS